MASRKLGLSVSQILKKASRKKVLHVLFYAAKIQQELLSDPDFCCEERCSLSDPNQCSRDMQVGGGYA